MSSDRTFPALQQRFRAAEANVRAPRGGVAFNGTAGQRVFGGLTGQNIGTDAASFAIGIRVPSAVPSASQGIFSVNSSGGTINVARSFFAEWRNDAGGHIRIWLLGATTGDSRAFSLTNIVNTFAGEEITLVLVRNGATITPYINGVVWTSVTTEATTGTPPSWADTITSTFYLLGTNSTGGVEHLIGPVRFFSIYNLALSAADVAEIHRSGGAVPERFQFGSQGTSYTSDFSVNVDGWSAISGTGLVVAAGRLEATHTAANGGFLRGFTLSPGRTYNLRLTHRLKSGASQSWFLTEGNDGANALTYLDSGTFTPAGTDAQASLSFVVRRIGSFAVWLRPSAAVTSVTEITGISMRQLGAIVHLDSESGGVGFQWHDSSTNRLDATVTVTGVSWLKPVRRGFVRAALSWSATHAATSLLGQRALPNGAVIDLITTKASAGSSGSGLTIGSATTGDRFVAANTFTTAKKVHTLANRLPANTGDNDCNLHIDPDTANYTGTIDVEVHYSVTEGNP